MKTTTYPLQRVFNTAALLSASVFTSSLLMLHSASAAPGDLDLTFDAGSGVDLPVRAMVLQPDGKILIGGDFRTVKGFVKHGLARLNPDGSNDSTFLTVPDPTDPYLSFAAIALQSDGKILIGGSFGTLNGVGRTNIARLNPDGTIDNTFDPGNGTYGSVVAIALQSDGKVLIGGYFTKVNGITRNYLARLNSNGSLDTGFDPGTAAVGRVNCLAVQPDGRVLFGAYDRISRLNTNGIRDTTFATIIGPDIQSIGLQADGKVLIGGGFSYINNILTGGFARLNANGSLDTNFNLGDPNFFYPNVSSISIQSDGKILTGGGAGVIIQTPMNRFNPDGTLDSSFAPNVLNRGSSRQVSLLALQADGKVIITGGFRTVNGVSRSGIARLNPDASLDETFNTGSGLDIGSDGYSINAIAAQSDGKILIGGSFDGVSGRIRSRIARLNDSGSLDTSFDPPLFPYPVSINDPAIHIRPTVQAITRQQDGKTLVGSVTFDDQSTTWTCDLARLSPDGNLDLTFNPVNGTYKLDGSGRLPLCVVLQTDGKIIFGGNFDSLNGAFISCIARLTPDGNLDSSFSVDVRHDVPNFYPSVRTVAVQPDGKIILGGSFTTVNGVSQTNFARLNTDGSLDFSFDSSFGTNSIKTVIAQPDGKLLVFGNRIARLNADGTLDQTFSVAPNSSAGSAALQPDGKIILGGAYVNGVSRSIARLNTDGILDQTFNSSGAMDGAVNCMALQPNGRLVIGGYFASVNGVARNYLARFFGGDSAVLNSQRLNNKFVLTWTNTGFNLQSAPLASGTFTNIPGATSPYTNLFMAPRQFFRLAQ